jgi:hypothetical protein
MATAVFAEKVVNTQHSARRKAMENLKIVGLRADV